MEVFNLAISVRFQFVPSHPSAFKPNFQTEEQGKYSKSKSEAFRSFLTYYLDLLNFELSSLRM